MTTEFSYDNGCEVMPVHLGCLTCPLPVCKYDGPLEYSKWKRQQADKIVVSMVEALKEAGKPTHIAVTSTAKYVDMTIRTIYRILHRTGK